MSSVVEKPKAHVNCAMATELLFKPWNRSELQDLDAVCLDIDSAIRNKDLNRCFQLIEESRQSGLQVLLIGSRKNLIAIPDLLQKDVTFIEKKDELAEASEHREAQVVNEILEKAYAPFMKSGTGYVNTKSSMSETAPPPLKNSKKAIDPAYFEPILTDEQRKALFAFLNTPEGEGEFPPPGVENA